MPPSRMPALYLGHGAPPLLDDPLWSGQLARLAGDLPRPTAILIVSAHWESAPISLSASGPGVGLVYDFGGFAEKYYRMTYPTPDASALAARVAAASAVSFFGSLAILRRNASSAAMSNGDRNGAGGRRTSRNRAG